MSISFGWFCLVGGVLGAARVATAKKFFRSDFANSDGVVNEGDYTTEIRLTVVRRWMIVAVCAVIAVVGALMIQHDNNWNPFRYSDAESPSASH
jgi:hypothetical protein